MTRIAPPSGVYLIALPIRLPTTRSICDSSATIDGSAPEWIESARPLRRALHACWSTACATNPRRSMTRRSSTRPPASMRETSRKLETRAWIFSPLSRMFSRTSGGMSVDRESVSVRSSVYPRMTVSGALMSCVIIERKSARACSAACCALQSRKTPISASASVTQLNVTSHAPRVDSTSARPSSPRQPPCSAAASTVSRVAVPLGSRTKSAARRPTMAEAGAPHASASAWFTNRIRPARSTMAAPSAMARRASARTSASPPPSTLAASPIVRSPSKAHAAAHDDSMDASERGRRRDATLRYRFDAARTWYGFSLQSKGPMGARFCARCGTNARAGSKFCAECGEPRAGAPAGDGRWRLTAAGMTVLGLFLSAGLAIWTLILLPARTRPVGGPRAAQTPAAEASRELPQGHPNVPIALPAEVKTFIADLAAKAKEKPDDAEKWAKLGQGEYRAAQLDPAYYAEAVWQLYTSCVEVLYNPDVTSHQQVADAGPLGARRSARNVATEDAVRGQIDETIARLAGDKAAGGSSPSQTAAEHAFRNHPIVR